MNDKNTQSESISHIVDYIFSMYHENNLKIHKNYTIFTKILNQNAEAHVTHAHILLHSMCIYSVYNNIYAADNKKKLISYRTNI